MTESEIAAKVRLLVGLSTDVIDTATLEALVGLAQDWCNGKAAAYHVSPPESAVVLMTEYYIRQNLDMRGIKPSSINMPGLSMSTDLRTACDMLMEQAQQQIKDAAYARGAAVKHIRSGKVALRWP